MDECFLHVLPFYDLLGERLGDGPDATSVGHGLVSAGISILERRLAELVARFRSGAIRVDLRHRQVNASTADEVAAMRPWSMSWSNVVDYFSSYAEFHACAR